MTRPSYTFGTWKLDCNAGALSGEAGIVALRPKSFEVLLFLIQNSGNLVSRDAILAAVWPNVIVTEESLTQCVSELRRAMDDTDQRIIKTVPKRGYLFAAQVLTLGSGDAERQALSAQQPLINEQSAQSGSHLPVRNLIEGPSVAVLPFANLSGDADQEYLSDGITEDVINGLSRFRDLSVIARNSTFGYKGKSFDVREIGQQLGVRYLVEGSVRRFGERIRITAQLIDAQSGVQRWSERFDRALGDIFDVQDEITRSIVAIVVAHLNSAEIERTAAKPAGSWTAYDLTLRGDQTQLRAELYWDAHYTYQARLLYTEALKIDPDNATICAKLGHTYVRAYADPTSSAVGNRDELERGFELARQAVGLDPALPLARAQLGWAYAWMKQPHEAIAEFEKASALNASFVDYRYSLALTFAGKPETALGVARDYVRLDPLYGSMLPAIRGIALYMLERYPDALIALRECRGLAPHVPGQAVLAATLMRLNQEAEARSIIAEVKAKHPHLTLARWPMSSVFQDKDTGARMFEPLRKAGFP